MFLICVICAAVLEKQVPDCKGIIRVAGAADKPHLVGVERRVSSFCLGRGRVAGIALLFSHLASSTRSETVAAIFVTAP